MANIHSKSFGVNFAGFDKAVQRYNKLLGNGLKPIIEDCLEVAPKVINPLIERDMEKHNKSGDTIRSLEKKNAIEWSGTDATVYVGFHISRGGLPSVFLMYGTARHYPNDGKASGNQKYHSLPDYKLADDIIGPGTQKTITQKQEIIFDREIKKAFEE